MNGLLELFGIFETLNFEALFGSWIGFVSLAVFGPLVPNPVVLFLSFEAFDPMVLFWILGDFGFCSIGTDFSGRLRFLFDFGCGVTSLKKKEVILLIASS